ncbi:putative heme-binding-like protein, chloroplastic-like isoform X1 [Capsicum annuum]|nr:putative heme-binding-like protein, chloroplastic-like isoform X1 [Capsicum annuum]
MKKQTTTTHISAAKMESEASHQQLKRNKLINNSQLSPTLPLELITEILSRLPIKTLLKFKCVSKSWLALISSPEFVKFHLSLNTNNKEYTHHKFLMNCRPSYNFKDSSYKVLMNYHPTYNFKDCSLSSLYNESSTEAKELDYPMKSYSMHRRVPYGDSIVGSANGLICLVIGKTKFFLWNPSIRKYQQLPDPKTSVRCFPRRAYGFGYDEFHDYTPRGPYGFGYDEFHDDYKVVCFSNDVLHDDGSCELEVKIYSLKSDSWRRVDDCPCPVQQYFSGSTLMSSSWFGGAADTDVECDRSNFLVEREVKGEVNSTFTKTERDLHKKEAIVRITHFRCEFKI